MGDGVERKEDFEPFVRENLGDSLLMLVARMQGVPRTRKTAAIARWAIFDQIHIAPLSGLHGFLKVSLLNQQRYASGPKFTQFFRLAPEA